MARISYGSPAAITRCHSSGPREESRTNDTPFPANSQDAPNAWMSAPPTAGPIMTPALRPAASSPFTHLMSFSRTRCETVAPDPDQNGDSATAARNLPASSSAGSWASAIAPKHAAR